MSDARSAAADTSSTAASAVIAIRDLTKRYEDGVVALDRLNLDVEAGEIYCLLGANGAGKTTTLNILMSFIEPTSGDAKIEGISVHKEPLRAKRHLAYVSENVHMYPNFTARMNLDFFARIAGRRGLTNDDYDGAMRTAGLPEAAFDRKVKAFSKGMRQKLGIAVAVIKDASALILDEPMSGLDPKAANDFVQTLRQLREQGKAILMSTHDVFRSKELADRVGIMRDGIKVAEWSAEELKREDLEALYLGYMRQVSGPAAPADTDTARPQ